ncbi:MAG: RHS repeat-associated core domain-containing protein [Planctomycetota bacterium]|nr:RHS repeat-associated core domain-containing protein [Planctomycetota bacterium]
MDYLQWTPGAGDASTGVACPELADWDGDQAIGGPRPTLHHANRQSSIRNHQSEAVYEYDVYGQVAASDPNHPNRFMFTGRRFDPETGLYYYRARYYNPSIGRFLQTDPIGYADGLNWHAYCHNNPVWGVDPFGLSDPNIRIVFYDGASSYMSEGADDGFFDYRFNLEDAAGLGMKRADYIMHIIDTVETWYDGDYDWATAGSIAGIWIFCHGKKDDTGGVASVDLMLGSENAAEIISAHDCPGPLGDLMNMNAESFFARLGQEQLGTYPYLRVQQLVARDAAGWVRGNEGFTSPPR